MSSAIRTTCPYCGVGCGIVATQTAGGVALEGDRQHPANFGRLCSKGAALGDTLDLENRLLSPRLHGREVAWDEALRHVAERFSSVIRTHGPDAVAFYVSGQLLTEDYYVANKLMKGFIGSANIDTNSRLCMSSAVAAHKRAFGEDIVPVQYDDLEQADLIVLVGSNTAWCHPVLFQRIVKAKEERPELKVVVIDPRHTPTCEIADLHLPIKAGTDVWLFNGLLAYLHQHGVEDSRFIELHTRDVARTLVVAENTAGDLPAVARRCAIQQSALEEFYRLFARTERVVTAFSQGINQSSAGTDKANSIINCHLLCGRVGRPGIGPFSITGQPNAMGGREVGGMANMLAAHMDLDRADHRQLTQAFWGSPVMASRPGLKAIDLFDAIHAGSIKAVWIVATNPVVSLPNANKVRAALTRCELVVVSDCAAATDTTALAHVLLPAAAWGEKEGTVTNSERCISRQRAFLPAPGAAKPDWWIFCEVAKRMGFTHGFSFGSAHEIFLEHARLSAAGNDGERAFDIGAMAELTTAEYDALAPTHWPVAAGSSGRSERLFENGRFFHADGHARFVPTAPAPPVHGLDAEYPFVLNTGRIRDQWHTMTRTGKAPRLLTHSPEPYVDMHEQDALLSGVRAGEFVRVSTRWGSLVARLRISGDLPRRMIFVPIHWNDAICSDARVGALVNPVVDPVSGEPEFKHTPARVAPFVVAWQGFILSRHSLVIKDITWWSRVQGTEFLRYELAGRRVFGDWSPWARRVLNATASDADWLEYIDRGTGIYRAAHLIDDRIDACLFISPRADLPPRAWLSSLFSRPALSDGDRAGLLAGQPANAAADTGPVICSCYGVSRDSICAAIREFRLTTPQQIGQRLRAGTNCGSCLPELKMILNEERAALPLM
jgi:assimilatory nitrate reductase catalytic subunit